MYSIWFYASSPLNNSFNFQFAEKPQKYITTPDISLSSSRQSNQLQSTLDNYQLKHHPTYTFITCIYQVGTYRTFLLPIRTSLAPVRIAAAPNKNTLAQIALVLRKLMVKQRWYMIILVKFLFHGSTVRNENENAFVRFLRDPLPRLHTHQLRDRIEPFGSGPGCSEKQKYGPDGAF